MLRATAIVRRPAVKPERIVDRLVLDHEARHRRRVALTAEGGLAFLLDLDRATALDDGDALRLEDGRLVEVRAAPERLIEITTGNPTRLTKVAWHVGNRHVAAEIGTDAIYIAHDHVLLELVRGLGATAREVERPFRPERGAYEGHAHEAAGHVHDAQCGHDHGHAHAPSRTHAHSHSDAHTNAHAHASSTAETAATEGHGHAHAHSHTHSHDR